jgi:hypothetical protein
VLNARVGIRCGDGPTSRHGVEDLSATDGGAGVVGAARHEHSSIVEQGRLMAAPSLVHGCDRCK